MTIASLRSEPAASRCVNHRQMRCDGNDQVSRVIDHGIAKGYHWGAILGLGGEKDECHAEKIVDGLTGVGDHGSASSAHLGGRLDNPGLTGPQDEGRP